MEKINFSNLAEETRRKLLDAVAAELWQEEEGYISSSEALDTIWHIMVKAGIVYKEAVVVPPSRGLLDTDFAGGKKKVKAIKNKVIPYSEGGND